MGIIDFFQKLIGGTEETLPRTTTLPFDARTWAVAGGKGGVGKSFVSSSLACGLAQAGQKVVLVDADLAGANIHTMFGIRVPEFTLDDFLKNRKSSIHDITIPTPSENLRLICGATDIFELANPNTHQQKKLIKGFSEIKADYVIIDIGAGSSLNNLDFFNMANMGLVVTSPTPTAIQNAYGFLKLAVQRRLSNLFLPGTVLADQMNLLLEGDRKAATVAELTDKIRHTDGKAAEKIQETLTTEHYRLIVNMATVSEGLKIAEALSSTAWKNLSIRIPHCGTLPSHQDVEASVRKMTPLLLMKDSPVVESVFDVIQTLTGKSMPRKPVSGQPSQSKADVQSAGG